MAPMLPIEFLMPRGSGRRGGDHGLRRSRAELAIESVKHFRAGKCWEIPEENGHLSTYLASYPSIYLSIHPSTYP